ncbi:MAG: DUF928 domain-containing protein [Rivularia sp. (in: cyanobacteria)]
MTWIKKNLYIAAIPVSLVLSIVSTISVRANSRSVFEDMQKTRTDLISQSFQTPDRGTLERSAGGATRGGCAEKEGRLVALMPEKKFGLTFKERPTFFWKVAKSKAQTAEFILLDDDDDLVYETNITLPKQQGIFAFTLPPESPALEVGKQYHWYLSIDCGSSETFDTITVEGWVERIKPNLAMRMKLNKSEPKYRSKIYAEAGIWHEAMADVAQQRCTFPSDSNVMLNWNQLLTSVGLSEVVSEPLNNSCKIEN